VLPLESVPNLSEGRDRRVIEELGAALSRRARLLDVHSDSDHHRSVFTLVGDDDALVDSLVAGIARARELIDLREHDGVHPRVGAADVVPLVPLQPQDMARARATALALAERVGAELALPVFLYGEVGEGRRPAFFRRGGPEELQRRVDAGEVAPAFGPSRFHPAAGAVLIGARRPLIAFNVDLRTDDAEVAREIAAAVRETGGGFPGVRALGLRLPRSGRVQVSMNVEDWEAVAPHEIVVRIEELAAARGVALAGSELVGLMPAGAAAAAAAASLRIEGFDARQVLELRLLDPVEEP
jgi:glutamate formiminotransferase